MAFSLRVRSFFPTALAGVVYLAACSNVPSEAPPQPVAFDHQVHVELDMRCTTCHPGAESATRAGLTPIAGCAVCHRSIATDNPEVVKVMQALENDEPLRWRRINALPDRAMVHFKHKPHARAGVPCSTCHGDVAQMTVARPVRDTADMIWCMACHRDQGASVDCLTCHY